jgi:flagellar protein FlaG
MRGIKVFIFMDDLEGRIVSILRIMRRITMEIFQTTAKIQQTQSVAPKPSVEVKTVQQIQKTQIQQDQVAQSNVEQKTSKIQSQDDMNKLIDQLNQSLNPFNTSLKFGFDDSSEDFYVSVIETKSNRMLRRFPMEQAELLLPKMQEVNGLLFDQKG